MQYKNYRNADFIKEIELRDKRIEELISHIKEIEGYIIDDALELNQKKENENDL